ncbi:phospholipase D-like domain-containing protein [Marinobacter sp. ATCH36]|uniref:phospholipase D-like domain-containing protein n=1 Tax=Marinobacter sp. ATCH36 TaxID=2945106 RepID=UPI0020218A65|nr:phospholipase D-like domain-containing protein [Marinobacter sp. ATCH36]MCL7944145.1 phospholipase D-like domain-containing protein [Marinobacter sp. ATCH36]
MTFKLLIGFIFLAITTTSLYHSFKSLPQGLSYHGDERPLINPKLLTDRTLHFGNEEPRLDQEIFAEIFDMIANAQQFVLVDMFLFNDSRADGSRQIPLASALTDALISRKQAHPEMDIIVISDPINTVYGGTNSRHFQQLRQAGIPVVETRLERLRDSNPIWSGLWRVCCQWMGNSASGGWLPNALGDQPVTLRSYLALPNFKANHRKTLVVDSADGFSALVTSANPHDGSSRHSNIGLRFAGPAVADLLRTERAVLAMSDADTTAVDNALGSLPESEAKSADTIKVVSESAILSSARDIIDTASSGDRLDLAMFYLSHRTLLQSLKDAHKRGVGVRVLLDANNDAFGLEKSGIPNRQAAMELKRAGITVRWCLTEGEQCHTKLLARQDKDGKAQLLLGSANFTRRNLDDLNLETSVHIVSTTDSDTVLKATGFFDDQWNHGPGDTPVMSLPYEAWADESRLRYWQYRLMETTGLSTF